MIARTVVASFLAMSALSGSAALATGDSEPPLWSVAHAIRAATIVDGSLIVVPRAGGIESYNAEGARVWRVNSVVDPVAAGPIVYADGKTSTEGTTESSLTALDAQTGTQLWSIPKAGGILAADGAGVVAGNWNGVARFGRDGRQRWHSNRGAGGYRRLLVNDRYVIALSVRDGALVHGEIESFDRTRGSMVGSQVWFGFGKLLSLDGRTAYGTSDFPGEPETICGSSELLAVSLGAVDPDRSATLVERRAEYVLDDVPVPTPAPPGVMLRSSTPCTGERTTLPDVHLADRHVVVTSGSELGVFDYVEPGSGAPPNVRPFARYHDATFIGGPFAGRIFVVRSGALFAMTIDDRHEPRFDRLMAGAAKTFTVAGLADRLYVSDGRTTTAFDAKTLEKRAEIAAGCRQLRALLHTNKSDVLECARGDDDALILGIAR